MRYVEVGLLIFPFAFILCITAEIMIIGEPWRLGAILEANPHFYLRYVRNVLLYSISPPAVGVAFIIFGYIKERKTFFKWQLAVTGGIILFWGVFMIRGVHAAYWDVMDMVTKYNIPISDLVLTIYVAVAMAKILWILAGVLSMHSYLYNTLRNEWNKYRKINLNSFSTFAKN